MNDFQLVVQVPHAITRQKKETIVANLKGKLSESFLVYGMDYKGVAVCLTCSGHILPEHLRLQMGGASRTSPSVCSNSLHACSNLCLYLVVFVGCMEHALPPSALHQTALLILDARYLLFVVGSFQSL